jgi:MFS transporter, OPA family, sugar phosphate sensor protein UhpC
MLTTRREQITVIVCMYIGYFMLMFCRTAFTTVSPALVEDPGLSLTTTHIGDILGYAALGSLAGKLITGFVADYFGGRLTLIVALAVVASLTAAMGYSASFGAFVLLIFCLQLLRAGGWPALTKLVAQWVPPGSYARTWGVLSTASRAGVVISSLVLGLLLVYSLGEVDPDTLVSENPSGWRWVPITAGGIGLLVVFALYWGFPKQPASAPRDPEETEKSLNLLATLRFFARADRFWLICISLMCITMLMALVSFTGLYLAQSFEVSAGKAATAATVFPFGCLIAVLLVGIIYDQLSRKQRIYFMGASLAVGCLCIAGLIWITEAPFDLSFRFNVALAMILLLGACIAPAYYLPMSVFSIEFGGKRSGVLVGFIDATGYAAEAAFMPYAGRLADQPGGWTHFMWLLLVIACVGLVSTAMFLYRDHRAYQGPRTTPRP